jgi:hypothetical protein
MKIALTVSLCLNLALAAWFMFSRSDGQTGAGHTKPAVSQPVAPPTAAPPDTRPASTAPASAVPEAFHWNQLYANDYHAYVRNLRATGCPEGALRAIVAADVAVVFQRRAAELTAKLSGGDNSLASQVAAVGVQEAAKAELLKLPAEQAAMIADYLGEAPPASSTAQDASAPQAMLAFTAPLVAQPVNLAALNLDPSQTQALGELQQAFIQQIGGPNQDPHDPAYQARWRAAQAQMDDLMKAELGDQAFGEYQIQADIQAQSQSSGTGQASGQTGAASAGPGPQSSPDGH